MRFFKRYVILFLVCALPLFAQSLPFTKGVNLTNWFQTENAHEIQFKRYTLHDFENIKSLGCDVIRLPINLHAMTSGAPDYDIDPLLFILLDQVVDWAEELNISLILDNHSFDPATPTEPTIVNVLVPVWQQMAQHFKNRSKLILYEVLNEPHGIDDNVWGVIQQQVIATIRAEDSVHTIVVGPASWNSYNNLQNLPEYADTNLIYTFHFYDPFVFTHQGASWTNPPMTSLAGVPFPYVENRMPACPQDLKGTWIESALNDYPNTGTVGYVRAQIDKAITFAEQRKVPVFCGELGVYMENSPAFDRVFWYQIVTDYLNQHDLPWTLWDYHGGFGLFKKGSNGLFEYDLNTDLLDAVGFNIPPQGQYELKPDSLPFTIYEDYVNSYIFSGGWKNGGFIDFYSDNAPKSGQFCLYWSNAGQYGTVSFDFRPNKDLSYLKAHDFALRFWVRGNSPAISFDVRFIDTKTGANDHPWRMKTTIDHSVVPFDGRWHVVQIPLKSFVEGGSWDNGWYDPIGAFDWTAIDYFEIVAEQQNMTGQEVWFDDIQVVNPATGFENQIDGQPTTFILEKIYPNPFNNQIVFELLRTMPGYVKTTIFNLSGEKVKTLNRRLRSAGKMRLSWQGTNENGQSVSSGVYLVQFKDANKTITKKILLIR